MTPADVTNPAEGRRTPSCYRFGRYELLPVQRQLRCEHSEVCVTPKAFDLLVALVERAGRLVSKNELLRLVWPNLVVEENNLQVQISSLRKILGAQAIATVPGRGYQFTLLADETAPDEQRVSSASTLPVGEDDEQSPLGNLPACLPPLFGRVESVVALTRAIERHRVVSVVGPSGMGKTRLAQAVAHALRNSYADGVWFAELTPLTAADQVVPTVLRLLGQAPAGAEVQHESLVGALQHLDLLLVLDGCEHVIGGVRELAVAVAGGALRVRLLITSQEPLRLQDEGLERLGALSIPSTFDAVSALHHGAVELFVARAQAADPQFALNASNVGLVVEICKRLDGLPLAIELAAARVRMGLQSIRERLDERFNLLIGGVGSTAPSRHHAMRAALAWSYELLSPQEREVLNLLGIFVGSFCLEAAQRLAGDDTVPAWEVADHVATLVDKSWILVTSDEPLRFRMLDSSRAFAMERLDEAGAVARTRRRHALAIVEILESGTLIEGWGARILRIGHDLDNARAAIAWATGPGGEADIAIALAGASHLLWDAKGCNEEGDWLHRTVESKVDDRTHPRLAARFWFAVSNLGLFTGLGRQAQAGLEAARLFRSLGDRYWLFQSLLSAAQKLSWMGDIPAAGRALSESKELLDPTWPLSTRSSLEHVLGTCKYFSGRELVDARNHFIAAIEIGRQAGNSGFMEDVADLFLMNIDHAQGDFAAAAERGLRTMSRPVRRIGTRNRTVFLGTLGASLAALGRLDEADGILRLTVQQAPRALGSTTWVLNHVALLIACQGRWDVAARLIGCIDASPTVGVIAKSPAQRRSYEDARALVAGAVGSEELDRLHAIGARMSEREVTALAFASPR